MADHAETPKILDEISRSNTAVSNSKKVIQRQKASRRFIIVLLLLSPILAGLFLLGYWQWTTQNELVALSQENLRLNTRLASHQESLQELQAEVGEIPDVVSVASAVVDQSERRLVEEFNRLFRATARLQQQGRAEITIEEKNFELAEVEQLLRLANLKVNLAGDHASAIILLESAESLLRLSDNIDTFPIHDAVSQELEVLRDVKLVDIESLHARLEKLITQVDDIVLVTSLKQSFASGNSQAEISELNDFGTNNSESADSATDGFLDSGVQFLKSVFVWRHWEEAPRTMLPPQQDFYLRQNLHLMLLQAQLALVTSNESLYRENLTKYETWLQQYRVAGDDLGASMLVEVEDLKNQPIVSEARDISASLSLLKQMNEN